MAEKLRPRFKGENPNDINTELSTPSYDKEQADILASKKKSYASAETARKLWGKKPGAFYAGDESHEEDKKLIDQMEDEARPKNKRHMEHR